MDCLQCMLGLSPDIDCTQGREIQPLPCLVEQLIGTPGQSIHSRSPDNNWGK